jgi:hypothetical protein
MPIASKSNDDLLEWADEVSGDPLTFVQDAFPWGEPGTPLVDYDGPDAWQQDVLSFIRDGLLDLKQAVQIAVASGHGPGKSTMVAWLILWGISTCPDTRGVVTANTMQQLMTKTWLELSKWFNLLICRHWFELTATRICARDRRHADTWRIDAVPWSENNTEAFAGLHNQGKRIVVLFDESSSILGDDRGCAHRPIGIRRSFGRRSAIRHGTQGASESASAGSGIDGTVGRSIAAPPT